ncbi:hypothetical protein [Micromonospora auratinigra]|uniref:Uncharacterized protein n=1 Tax=Micromonospora auratinigra TaxID=261654 RepID=A0A1A8Z0E5_9ACTN|nr:hypothetical protein [Micromonospora auratinigra]SBT37265.1 hypothetical protein GA0070611_0143 [Micromonospora auratinigra]
MRRRPRRTLCLALLLPVTAVLMVLAGLGVAPKVLVPLVWLFALAMGLGVLTAWAAALLLSRSTSRYSGAARGTLDIRKVRGLIRQVARDVVNVLRW